MQGSSASFRQKFAVTVTVALTFVASAVLIFGIATAIGELARTSDLPVSWRYAMAGTILWMLAVVDYCSLRRARYCLIGLARQTPRSVMFRYNFLVAAAVWGFDTGLAFTTIRVAGLTWAAFLLPILGLAPWWTGIAYAVGFAVPLAGFICLHPAGRVAASAGPVDPGLGRLLDLRAPIQIGSIVLLSLAGLYFTAEGLLGGRFPRM